MTDKVQKIKEEIERRINDLKGYVLQKGSDQRWVTAIDQLTWIKAFIDSLPEESASEDLDRLVISLEETIGTNPHSREVIKEHLQKAAEWGRNHFEDKSEMVSEDLDIAATSIIKRLGGMEKDDCVSEHEIKIFKAAIELQRKKDQETIELAEDHAMLAGMNKMKEEMMKNAVECVVEDWCGDSPEITIPLNPQDFKMGDKVKIIIVKEEQQ